LVKARVPTDGFRLVCYCNSCREFVSRLGCGDRLNAAGGNDLIQVEPGEVEITGAENLRWMKVTEKGPMRWYAQCCDTPMANTLSTRKLPFASFQVHDIEPQLALPEIRAHVNLKGALARVDEPLGSVRPLILSFLGRILRAWISGRWRQNPFFGGDGTPIAERADP
jgi:hypothetical protein